MERYDAPDAERPLRPPFWRSRAGVVLVAFLAVGALLLGYEHRAHVFSGEGLLSGLLVACIAMHLFMHHGHGGQGGGGASDGGGRS